MHQLARQILDADSNKRFPALCLCHDSDCAMQSRQQAQTLLDNMHFFSLSHTLLSYGQGEAVVMVMMRFVEAAAALGEPFFRWPYTPDPPSIPNLNLAACKLTMCLHEDNVKKKEEDKIGSIISVPALTRNNNSDEAKPIKQLVRAARQSHHDCEAMQHPFACLASAYGVPDLDLYLFAGEICSVFSRLAFVAV